MKINFSNRYNYEETSDEEDVVRDNLKKSFKSIDRYNILKILFNPNEEQPTNLTSYLSNIVIYLTSKL